MKAVILAAGRGSRLKNLTDDKPKCFIEILGKPMIEWQIEALRKAGIDDIAVVVGYKKEQFSFSGVTYIENPKWQETNMFYSLLCAKEWIKSKSFIISYSDILYLSDTIKKMMSNSSDILIPYNTKWREVWESRFENPLIDLETFKLDNDNRLIDIGDRPDTYSQIDGQFMGLLKFSEDGWNEAFSQIVTFSMEEHYKLDMTKFLQKIINNGICVNTLPVEGNWFEIDSGKDIESFKSINLFE